MKVRFLQGRPTMKKILDNIEILKNDCWVWKKSCSSSGYGQFTVKGTYWSTHRYVWQQLNGDIEEGLVVRHKCHNRACCNPDHLELGTHKENYHDSYEVHINSQKKQRKIWIVGSKKYETCRMAVLDTGISVSSIIKFTNKETREFDIDTYRSCCKKANQIPKI
tara:strand:+ start:148 stop:639 length:492 start_codon:yes stop_codon:yes gene_type:complete